MISNVNLLRKDKLLRYLLQKCAHVFETSCTFQQHLAIRLQWESRHSPTLPHNPFFKMFSQQSRNTFKKRHKNPKASQQLVPVVKILSDDQMFEVVVDSPLVVLQQRVGVSQAVAGLRFHSLVLQEPGQLQGSPEGEKAVSRREAERMSLVGVHRLVSLLSLRPRQLLNSSPKLGALIFFPLHVPFSLWLPILLQKPCSDIV